MKDRRNGLSEFVAFEGKSLQGESGDRTLKQDRTCSETRAPQEFSTLKIQVANTVDHATEVLIRLACAPTKPSPHDVGTAVGSLRVTEDAKKPRRGPRTTATVSLGPKKEVTPDVIRNAAGSAARWLGGCGAKRAAVELDALTALEIENAVEALCEGLNLGAFAFAPYKSERTGMGAVRVVLIAPRAGTRISATVRRTHAISEAVNLAREWGHEPPNVINPVTLARRCTKLARESGLKCTVLDDKQLARMKAEAILSVGVGSKTPSRLIILEHRVSRGATTKPIVLVGKAVTFDTGGYSLKDRSGIVGMKYDKCGGMAVIGTLMAAAALKIKTPVVGIIAAAENMISAEAYRPNDIIKTMSGKTVEIISTDAEGRLVLADALTYAQRRYRPKAVIDLATLTGGVVVALGSVRAGLFANNDALAEKLLASGERVHERLWRLPLDDEYLEPIKGEDSDLKNSGGRSAHPIIGGMFLKQFVDKKTPWAHLDIAGVGDAEKDMPYCPKGATGFGVRLLIDYLTGR